MEEPCSHENDKLLFELNKVKALLEEHFDTVQIFCTRHRAGDTFAYTTGGGNLYARIGQVSEWLGDISED